MRFNIVAVEKKDVGRLCLGCIFVSALWRLLSDSKEFFIKNFDKIYKLTTKRYIEQLARLNDEHACI